MSAKAECFQVWFGNDMHSEWYMLSDDPSSTEWVVTLVGDRPGSGVPRREVPRQTGTTLAFVRIPGKEWVPGPISAWDVDALYAHACHVEIADAEGRTEMPAWSFWLHSNRREPCPHRPMDREAP